MSALDTYLQDLDQYAGYGSLNRSKQLNQDQTLDLNFNIIENNNKNSSITENKHVFSNTKRKEIDAIDDMIDNYHTRSQQQRDKD